MVASESSFGLLVGKFLGSTKLIKIVCGQSRESSAASHSYIIHTSLPQVQPVPYAIPW